MPYVARAHVFVWSQDPSAPEAFLSVRRPTVDYKRGCLLVEDLDLQAALGAYARLSR